MPIDLATLVDPAHTALDDRAEALLYAADKAQHVHEVIGPALSQGRDVVCDRFSASTVAYQGYGRGLDPADLARLSSWASDGLEPDVVILLTVPPQEAVRRRVSRRAGSPCLARMR